MGRDLWLATLTALVVTLFLKCGCATPRAMTAEDIDITQNELVGIEEMEAPLGGPLAEAVVHVTFATYFGLNDVPRVKVHYTRHVFKLGERKLVGLHYSCDNMWVTWEGSYHASSLAHEMGHCYKHFMHGDGDADHNDVRWWGPHGAVGTAEESLKAFGL